MEKEVFYTLIKKERINIDNLFINNIDKQNCIISIQRKDNKEEIYLAFDELSHMIKTVLTTNVASALYGYLHVNKVIFNNNALTQTFHDHIPLFSLSNYMVITCIIVYINNFWEKDKC